ncbi:MAG: hypothetical protein RL215_1656 [Planctomycetota bacterium]
MLGQLLQLRVTLTNPAELGENAPQNASAGLQGRPSKAWGETPRFGATNPRSRPQKNSGGPVRPFSTALHPRCPQRHLTWPRPPTLLTERRHAGSAAPASRDAVAVTFRRNQSLRCATHSGMDSPNFEHVAVQLSAQQSRPGAAAIRGHPAP